jgi:hypothetical protein
VPPDSSSSAKGGLPLIESDSGPATGPLPRALSSAWEPAWSLIRSAVAEWRGRVLPGSEAETVLDDLSTEIDVLERVARAYLGRWAADVVDETSRAAEEWIGLAWAEREKRLLGGATPQPARRPGNGAAAEFDARLGGDP